MSEVESENADSSDSEIYVLKQIRPVNKSTLQKVVKIKNKVLSSFHAERNKTNRKRSKVRKRSADSFETKSKKKRKAAEGGGNSKNKLLKHVSSPNLGECSGREFCSDEIEEDDVEIVKEITKPSPSKKKLSCLLMLGNGQSQSPSKVSESSDNIQLSPGIRRKRNKFKIYESSESIISKSKRVKKPLITLFDKVMEVNSKNNDSEKETLLPQSENEGESRADSNISEEEKLDEFLDTLENNINEVSQPEKHSSLYESQNDLSNSAVEKKEEKYVDNSELLCFLLKKIIRDETNKQVQLISESLEKGKPVEKLLSKYDYGIIEKFFNLSENSCKLFVRMLHRKKHWHRVSNINYQDISNNLNIEFDILSKEHFIDINIEDEELKIQMDLLSKPEVLKLCKEFNVSSKYGISCKKEILIASVINESQKQKSVLDMFKGKNSTSRLDQLKRTVKNYLGMCVRLSNKIYEVFYKILLLFSFDHYYDEEDKRVSQELLMCSRVHKNMIKFPKYKISPTVVFETYDDFEEYKKSLLLQDSFEIAIESKNHDNFVSAFNKARIEFEKLLMNNEYQKRFMNLQPFLKKFSAGTVYARILTKYCKTFKKKTDSSELIKVAQLLLDQNLFLVRKRGEWYEILSKALESQKLNASAAEVIIKGVEDPLVNEVQKLSLQLRGQFILKKKTYRINVTHLIEKLNEKCVLLVQEPHSIEIKGKALEGNESGFKCVYIQESQHGKLYSSVEERAISYYKINGFTRGFHTEGLIIQSIYFLLFYDVIYGLSPEGVFQSPYQEAPLDLYSSTFYHNRKEEIDLLLSDMLSWSDQELEFKLKDSYYKNWNTICIIKWTDHLTPELLAEIAKCITMPILILIFQRLIRNLRVTQSGFPDLTLWNPETKKCKFVEVKSPKDKLSPAQRLWLDYLGHIGLDCEVCNVKKTLSAGDKFLKIDMQDFDCFCQVGAVIDHIECLRLRGAGKLRQNFSHSIWNYESHEST